MPFLTPRQRGLAAVVVVLVAVAVVGALAGQYEWTLGVLAALVGCICVLLLDIRRRLQLSARSHQRLEAVVAEVGESLGEDVRRLLAVAEKDAATLIELRDLKHEEAEAAAERDAETSRRLARLDYEPVNEMQALLQLVSKVPDAPPLPGVGGWALSAVTLLELWDLIVTERPHTIVECGSGASTVWLAYAAQRAGSARVISLEHSAQYADETRALLTRHGLEADVRYAPLKPVTVDDRAYRWYDMEAVEDLGDIDLLVVDGPPKSTGEMARFPAVPLLRERLSPGAFVVMDDAYRPDERVTTARWSDRYGVRAERQLSRDAALLRSP